MGGVSSYAQTTAKGRARLLCEYDTKRSTCHDVEGKGILQGTVFRGNDQALPRPNNSAQTCSLGRNSLRYVRLGYVGGLEARFEENFLGGYKCGLASMI